MAKHMEISTPTTIYNRTEDPPQNQKTNKQTKPMVILTELVKILGQEYHTNYRETKVEGSIPPNNINHVQQNWSPA